jgi:hypothetical protein
MGRQCRSAGSAAGGGPAVPVKHELDEQLDELSGKLDRKSSIRREIEGI